MLSFLRMINCQIRFGSVSEEFPKWPKLFLWAFRENFANLYSLSGQWVARLVRDYLQSLLLHVFDFIFWDEECRFVYHLTGTPRFCLGLEKILAMVSKIPPRLIFISLFSLALSSAANNFQMFLHFAALCFALFLPNVSISIARLIINASHSIEWKNVFL